MTMMSYIKRRFSVGDVQNEPIDGIMTEPALIDSHIKTISRRSTLMPYINASNHSVGNISNSTIVSNIGKSVTDKQIKVDTTIPQFILKVKTKLLFVIDDEQIDW